MYRARDLKLDRDVAIKILPEAFASDPERIARFNREAKTLAALNHPNIAHIHGLEESNGIGALVMELVDGTTLADRLARGRLPIKEALTVAAQIADALDAAHEKKVVRFRRTHRTVGSIVDFFAIETDASLLKVHISDDAALSARSKVIHRWAVAPAGPVQPFSGVLNFVR